MAADRQDAAAQSASLSEVRATLLRVADRLSSTEQTPSPSEYRATFVKYEEVYMCSIKFVFVPTQAHVRLNRGVHKTTT